MKTILIYENVADLDGMKKGIGMAIEKLAAIGFSLEIDYKLTERIFSGTAFSNETVGKGACVDPSQILEEAPMGYRLACLIYDWNKVNGLKPTNPVFSAETVNGCSPFQVPVNWYSDFTVSPNITYPEVLCQFFLHELSHALAYLAGEVDNTHFQYKFPEWSNRQPTDFYLFLIFQLRAHWQFFGALPEQAQPAAPAAPAFPILAPGMTDSRVMDLQKNLSRLGYFSNPKGFTSFFGPITKAALIAFQNANAITPTGNYGPLSDAAMQKRLAALIPAGPSDSGNHLMAWALAIQKFEGYYAGSRAYRNCNPGNIRFVGQASAIGKDAAGFCIFPDYATGFEALKSLLRTCATGSKLYDPNGDLYAWAAVYAPSSDGNAPRSYAEFVAKSIGVPVTTKIRDLV